MGAAWRRLVARGAALAVGGALLVVPPAVAGPEGWGELPGARSVAGKVAGNAPVPGLAVDAAAVTKAPEQQVAATARGGAVEVVEQGGQGVLFRVARAGAPVSVELDYAGMRHAFGGDYASRLRVVDVATGEVVPARNDVEAGKVHVEVAGGRAGGWTAGPDGTRVAPTRSATYALTAGTSGESGSFSPTSLAPSATWAVGVQSGDFSWNHPIEVPPAPGPTPQVALSYSSGVVDGRTASTNNQASWLGEGFSYEPGFIERTYEPCAEDGEPGKGDLCWDRQAAHIVLPGLTGELVWDAGRDHWRAANDEGWRVELRTGAANGDDDGEHWLVTGPDGTRYSFGSAGAAESVWTAPVFGNDAGEPCHGPSFDTSWCRQAYRWNLDLITDTHGDQVSYHYDTEVNHYGRAGVAGNATPYVRAGHLTRIDYGHRAGTEPTARVVFTGAPRCIPGSACQPSRPADWPDTPWDLACAGGGCAAAGPSFWGTTRLASITTQVRSGDGFADVDSWRLDHVFPATADHTSPTLWLRALTRTGHVGGTATMPPLLFDGVRLPNRVPVGNDLEPMNKWRLSRVHNETGGSTEVTYLDDPCDPGSLPRQDVNAEKCFPSFWLPTGLSSPQLGWFAKYVVGEVAEVDRVGGAPHAVTRYEYVDEGAAWHYDAAELVPDRFKTWGAWRGFQKVRVSTGGADGPRTLTEHLFLRGMDGDVLLDGGTRDVKVQDSQGKQLEDVPGYAGFARETVVRDAVTGAEVSARFQQPWLSEPTAVRQRQNGPLEARILKVDSVQTRTPLPGGGSRMSETTTSHDGYGTVTKVHDLGDVAVPDDDLCTVTGYARNTDAWIVDRPNRVTTASVPCDDQPTQVFAPADVISDERTAYDGADSTDTPPTKGDVTRTEELASWDGDRPVYVTTSRATHDAHGRVVTADNATGSRTTTTYTPATGGPVAAVTTTNALGHTGAEELEPYRGRVVATTDANGRRGEQTYDPLGRLTAAWRPGRPSTEPPTARYEYLVRADAPSVVTTHRLLGSGQYLTSHTLHDGLLRERQTQQPSPAGGRIVTDTLYDSHGRVAKTNAAYHNPEEPGTSLLVVADADVPSQEAVEHDGAGRTAAEVLRSYGVERHRTTYRHEGDRVSVDPPAGGTPTTSVTDVRGRLVELRQYTGDGPDGEHHTTRYGYTKAGKRSSVTDAAGNTWRFEHDLRGRQVRVDDPDKGVATSTYDDEDRLTSVTDARGVTLTHTYDALGRRTGVSEGTDRRAEWTFDALPGGIGEPAAAIRHTDGAAYRTEVTGYDALGLPTGTAVTVPAREGALAGRYEVTETRDQAGALVSTGLPAVGDLPAETVTTGYTALGQADTLGSDLAPYVTATGYTAVGGLGHRILGDRVMRSYAYDDATRRLTGLKTELETGEVAVDLALGHDPAGNIVSSADAASGDTQCFRGDALRRLVEAWTTTADCAAGPSTAALGGPAPYWHTYGYDAAGNRTREQHHAESGDTTRDYAYPAVGQAGPHRVTSVTTGSVVDGYTYDAAGNTVGRPGQVLAWNAEGRLARVDAGGQVTTFEYDADGDRLLRHDPEADTLYLGDTEVRLDRATGALTATRHYGVDGTVLAVRTGAGLSWLVDDHAGTAGTAIAAADLAVTTRRRLPYGAPRGTTPAWPSEQGFVGGTNDASTGLVHLGAREYDPAIGAFASADPILNAEDPQQLQGYAYAGNSPVSHADPTGLTARLLVGSWTEPITWDSGLTGFRWSDDVAGPGLLHTPHPTADARDVLGGGDTGEIIKAILENRGGWSPKVPPGYQTPPPSGSLPPIPTTPGPTRPTTPDGYPVHSPGEGSWRVDCRTSGAVRTCHYTPIKSPSTSFGGGYEIGTGWGGGSAPYGRVGDDYEIGEFDYVAWDVEEREYWEYDRCKPWNPCDTKPGKVEGYSPPGLYTSKSGSKTNSKAGSAHSSKSKSTKTKSSSKSSTKKKK